MSDDQRSPELQAKIPPPDQVEYRDLNTVLQAIQTGAEVIGAGAGAAMAVQQARAPKPEQQSPPPEAPPSIELPPGVDLDSE